MTSPPQTAPRRPSRQWSTLATWGVLIGTWAVLLGARARLLRDPGTFWHIVVGDRILDSGLPWRDWLSFTASGRPWIAQQWLAEVAMAALHRAAGLDGLLVATTGLLAVLFAWLFHRAVTSGLAARWALLLVALAFLATAHHLHVRPHLVSIAAFAWTYALLVDFEAGRIPATRLALLWLAFVPWVNAHGGALGGLATVAIAVVWWIAAYALGWRSPVRGARDAVALGVLLAGCAASVFLNPYGAALPKAWLTILRSTELPRLVVEHASLAATGSWQVLALAAVYVAVLAGTLPRRPGITALLPLVWLALAVDRVRNAPLFAVAATIAIAELLPRTRWIASLASRGVWVARGPAVRFPRFAWAAVAVVLALVPVAQASVRRGGAGETLLATLDERRWPVSLVPAIENAARGLPAGAPILNDVTLGGFLLYEAPRLRVFIDDRFELYGDDFLRRAVAADRHWLDAWVDCAGVTLALAERGGALERYLLETSGWRALASSEAAVLMERAPIRRAPASCPPP